MKNLFRILSIVSVLTLFSTMVSANAPGKEGTVFADYMLLNISPKASTPVGFSINTNVHNHIIEIGGGYMIRDASPSVELLAGVRYTNLEMSLSPGLPVNAGESLLDGFGGVRLIQEFGENSNWSLIGKADMGGGSSDLNWNAMALVNWRYKEQVSVSAGYKWLAYDYQTGTGPSQYTHDGIYQGPTVSISFSW